ncbi:hypothetical protein LA080_015810 [Diaporthe eres]|nr:hypothetical protein LA080_015810 [Diaporthe eres]
MMPTKSHRISRWPMRVSQDGNHAADASPELGLGQVSRPWLTPILHLAPGRVVAGTKGSFACGRVERTDGVGQFPAEHGLSLSRF